MDEFKATNILTKEIKYVNNNNKSVQQWQIWMADIPYTTDSVQYGKRPVIVISNNNNNKFSSCVTLLTLTTSKTKSQLPTHLYLDLETANNCGIRFDSTVIGEQIMTFNKSILLFKIGSINDIKTKIEVSLKFMIQFFGCDIIVNRFKEQIEKVMKLLVINSPKYKY